MTAQTTMGQNISGQTNYGQTTSTQNTIMKSNAKTNRIIIVFYFLAMILSLVSKN